MMDASDQQLQVAGNTLGELLAKQGRTLATAESCTGGWVANILTDRAGSSAYLMAGLVTYSNEAKQAILGVEDAVLAKRSEERRVGDESVSPTYRSRCPIS